MPGNPNKLHIIGLIALVAFALVLIRQQTNRQADTKTAMVYSPPADIERLVADPIDQAHERVTKKPFGIYITPKNSPVQPEKFNGYHTGTDFEAFADEANTEVPFYAICDGKIIDKRAASGYGGLLVQSCSINHQPVTVIYGHVSLKSIAKTKGANLSAGEPIGSLGQPPNETDGERKHLHLGIHKGLTEDIRGYVRNESMLTAWMDWQKL